MRPLFKNIPMKTAKTGSNFDFYRDELTSEWQYHIAEQYVSCWIDLCMEIYILYIF